LVPASAVRARWACLRAAALFVAARTPPLAHPPPLPPALPPPAGLCCGALLARYGYRVTVLESHYLPGGAAHGFEVPAKAGGGVYKFDAGPSFHAGLSAPFGKSSNPLKQVMDAVGESVECATYNRCAFLAAPAARIARRCAAARSLPRCLTCLIRERCQRHP
jgi:hypothetical protein